MKEITDYLLRYACPLFIPDVNKKTVQLIGTSIPILAGEKRFLITAGHIADYKKNHILAYLTDKNDLVGFTDQTIGNVYRSTCNNKEKDKLDFTLIEINANQLSNEFTFVPSYMINKTLHLSHINRISLLGYPISKNKSRYKNKTHKLSSYTYNLQQVSHEEYFQLQLDPIRHFCVRFDPQKTKDENGNFRNAPDPHGMSGGPAWHRTMNSNTDEGAILLGLTLYHDNLNKVIWGVRISYVLRQLITVFPSLEDTFDLPRKINVSEPADLQLWKKSVNFNFESSD